jgi:DNA-directed RNA polymerase subunit RPC12/RpoP
MWVSMDMAGRAGRCRYCGERLVVPHASGTMARPVAPAAAAVSAPRRAKATVTGGGTAVAPPPPPELQTALCSICQTPILTTEERMACPSCHLTFHAQCWAENYGCSAYGCDQVNVLAAPEDGRAADEQAAATGGAYEQDDAAASATPLPPPPQGFPWEPVLLALAFVATGLGAPAYGIPPVAIVLWAGAFLLLRKGRRKGLVAAALVVALAGCVAGYATSMFLWKGVRVWETMLK